MKRILLPTDFSVPSKAAFKFALDMALKAQAEVYAVHMIELPLFPETTFGIQPYRHDLELLKKAKQAATKAFEEVKKQFPSEVKVHFNTINDYVVPGLRVFIETNNIDLVIMSTHGASDLNEFFVGSTAEKIARFSPVPVISIPKEVKFDSIRNIVFPSTLELNQNDLVTDLKELQQLLNARLHILLINTPLKFYSDQQAREVLEKFVTHYELRNFTLNVRNHQFERSGILEFMHEIKGDMIAMATHGRTGIAHLFKGSIAEDVLNRIDHPIWTWKLKSKTLG